MQQRLVSGILHESVLEGVLALAQWATTQDQFGSDELVQSGCELGLGPISHRSQQGKIELAADAGGDFGNLGSLGNPV